MWKKLLVERELRGKESRRKQQDAIEVVDPKKVLAERELRAGGGGGGKEEGGERG